MEQVWLYIILKFTSSELSIIPMLQSNIVQKTVSLSPRLTPNGDDCQRSSLPDAHL